MSNYGLIVDTLHKISPRIEASLPKGSMSNVPRMIEIMKVELRKNPKLAECTLESVGAALLFAARLGLEPDSQIGHFYMIPYNKKCTVILGYPGLIELALRSPFVSSIYCRPIYANDVCDVQFGTETKITHIPATSSPIIENKDFRGGVVGAYSVVKYKNGTVEAEYMNLDQIEMIRRMSQSADRGPWREQYGAMARKSVLRRLSHYIPKAFELQWALAIEGAIDSGKADLSFNLIDDAFEGTVELETQNPEKQEAPTTQFLNELKRAEETKS